MCFYYNTYVHTWKFTYNCIYSYAIEYICIYIHTYKMEECTFWEKNELIKTCYHILIKTILSILGDNLSKPEKQVNIDGGIFRI